MKTEVVYSLSLGPTCRLDTRRPVRRVRRRLGDLECHPRLVVVLVTARHLLDAVKDGHLGRAQTLGRVAVALAAPTEQVAPASWRQKGHTFIHFFVFHCRVRRRRWRSWRTNRAVVCNFISGILAIFVLQVCVLLLQLLMFLFWLHAPSCWYSHFISELSFWLGHFGDVITVFLFSPWQSPVPHIFLSS